MPFTVTGHLAGAAATVTWTNGRLTGDPWAVRAVLERARSLEGTDIGPIEGPYTNRLHMRTPIGAITVIAETFDAVDDVTGDVPERSALPIGAIG